MNLLKRYLFGLSLTVLSGSALVLLGIYLTFAGDFHTALGQTFGEVFKNFTGENPSPAMLIGVGLGLLGIRSKQERG